MTSRNSRWEYTNEQFNIVPIITLFDFFVVFYHDHSFIHPIDQNSVSLKILLGRSVTHGSEERRARLYV